jgi:hypothetical protein
MTQHDEIIGGIKAIPPIVGRSLARSPFYLLDILGVACLARHFNCALQRRRAGLISVAVA